RYYLDVPLIDPERFKASFNKIALPDFGDTRRPAASSEWGTPPSAYQQLTSLFTEALTDLHKALKLFLPVELPSKRRDKGNVRHIYFSLFGFSRGAAQARAFANWFVWLCQLDAQMSGRAGLSLGTIPVTFDFMGLFDTVASVGIASSAPVFGAHGHYAWADSARSLRLCDPAPTQTLHLVSAHEVRRSFPLDSMSFRTSLPANCKEIVFPGVHSDVGGGYGPKEQGRGKDAEGADMLSRIALATMYRAARLAGVPLKLEEAPESVKRSFQVDPGVIQVFNAYVQACAPSTAIKEEAAAAPLHVLMARQHKLYIQWRKKMAGKMDSLPSFAASDAQGKEDIRCADREFMEEVTRFEAWRERDPYREGGDQDRGWPEWEEVDTYWDAPAPPSAVTDLFELFVHDSRAGFKPFGKDVGDLQLDMEKLVMREEAIADWQRYPVGRAPQPLSAAERNRLAKYMPYRGKPNASEGIDPVSEGREPMLLGGGFLRYRKIYMGSDRYKPSGAMYSGLLPSGQMSDRRLAVQEEGEMAPVAV
ncbi:MAG TPA: DUF2235 domain-containing protein, partial [Noviherbaspirillum sp.]|nr:DUF2235 domain-containing protein [Noviherbaspirillum sp.]